MSTTLSSPLLSSHKAGVLTLTLNRPDVLNSLTDDLLDALAAELTAASTEESVRAVVITGAGRGFCAGQDLNVSDGTKDIDVAVHLRDHYVPAITAMRSLEKPVIASINGVAAGAGLSLALAADLRIAAESATFVQAFVRIGLVPDAGSTFFLPRIVGTARAAELMMLGDSVDSQTALSIGMVGRVVADNELATCTAELAGRLARGPRSIGLIKRVLNQSMATDLQTQFSNEEKAQSEAVTTADFSEGIAAFFNKRPAAFTGR